MTALTIIAYLGSQRPTIVTPLWRGLILEGLVLFAAEFAASNGKPLTHSIRYGDGIGDRYEATIYPPGMSPDEDAIVESGDDR